MTVKISPSATDTYQLCNRKWGWRKLDGITAPQHPSAWKGTQVHNHLENWLLEGIAPPDDELGRLAMALIPTLPQPGECEVERKFEFEFEGITYHGKIDCESQGAERMKIRDHKTTSDLKWAKDEDSFDDHQAIVYAQAAFEEYDVDEVDFEWGYVTTRGKRRTRIVKLHVLREENEDRLRKLNETAIEMVDAVERGLEAMDLEPNAMACDAYGGCFYRDDHCKLTSTERMKSIMANGSLKERLAKRKAEKEAAGDEEPKAEAKTESKTEDKPKRKRSNKSDAKASSSASSKTEDAPAPKGVNPPAASAGLTLRDQFALSALNGLLANTAIGTQMVLNAEGSATKAYELADAMLGAR